MASFLSLYFWDQVTVAVVLILKNNDFIENGNRLRLRTLNNEEIVIKKYWEKSQKLKIPKVPAYDIYQRDSFSFKSD